MDEISALLDELETLLDEAKSVPFTGKKSVDSETMEEIINDIRLKLPNELKQAKWIISERDKILIDAQREADEALNNVNDRVAKLVDEHEITKRAYEQSAIIMENGKNAAREMHLRATEYVAQVLTDTEACIKDSLVMIQEQNLKTVDFFSETLNMLRENKQELRGRK